MQLRQEAASIEGMQPLLGHVAVPANVFANAIAANMVG